MASLFERLQDGAAAEWAAYVRHPFVEGIARGDLPEAAFRRYLTQDYLFLIHFARAYALAVVKADDLAGMRSAQATLNALLDHEMSLHVDYCATWGISAAELEGLEAAPETLAYTSYVLERGFSGDVLDLKVALAPCVVGYRDIAAAIQARADFRRDGNRYLAWIETYADPAYVTIADEAVAELDRLAATRATEARLPALTRSFAEACRLEAGFFEMGWRARKSRLPVLAGKGRGGLVARLLGVFGR